MTQLKLASTWDLESELGVGRVVQARSGAVDAVIQFGPKTAGAEREMLFAELGDARNVVPIIACGETSDSWVRQWHQKALLIT